LNEPTDNIELELFVGVFRLQHSRSESA
jgi:hypothetical protein